MAKTAYDLAALSEDNRIDLVGEAAAGAIVGVILEREDSAKIERYIAKVTGRYPRVRLIDRVDGPTSLAVTLRFGPKVTS